jgi:hypothetical protein
MPRGPPPAPPRPAPPPPPPPPPRYGGRCRFHRFVLDSSRYAPWPPGGMGDVAAFIALC